MLAGAEDEDEDEDEDKDKDKVKDSRGRTYGRMVVVNRGPRDGKKVEGPAAASYLGSNAAGQQGSLLGRGSAASTDERRGTERRKERSGSRI